VTDGDQPSRRCWMNGFGLGLCGGLVGTLELVIASKPFIVLYRVKGERLEIIAIFHGRRKWCSCPLPHGRGSEKTQARMPVLHGLFADFEDGERVGDHLSAAGASAGLGWCSRLAEFGGD